MRSLILRYSVAPLAARLSRPIRQGPLVRKSHFSSHARLAGFSRSLSELPRYSRIRIADKDDAQRLYDLIINYMTHPEQAASVTELVFRYPGHYYTESQGYPTHLLADEGHDPLHKEILSEAVRRVSFDGQDVEQDVRVLLGQNNNCQFTTLASSILLTLCPNVETLKYGGENTFVTELLRRNNFGMLPGRYLQKLRNVTLLPPNDDGRSYIANDLLKLVQCFHRLPSIDSIDTKAVEPDHAGGNLEVLPPGTSNSTKLSIGHTTYGSTEVSTLIRVPKALEEFTYTSGGRWGLSQDLHICDKKDLAKALLCHRRTLRKLDLDIDEHATGGDSECSKGCTGEHWNVTAQALDRDVYFQEDQSIMKGPLLVKDLPDTRQYGNSFGSLHDFEALTHLSIGVETLLGTKDRVSSYEFPWVREQVQYLPETPFRLVEALPETLQYLVIRGYERGKEPSWDSQFDELLAQRAEKLPNLKEVHGIDTLIPSAKTLSVADAFETEHWTYDYASDDWEVIEPPRAPMSILSEQPQQEITTPQTYGVPLPQLPQAPGFPPDPSVLWPTLPMDISAGYGFHLAQKLERASLNEGKVPLSLLPDATKGPRGIATS